MLKCVSCNELKPEEDFSMNKQRRTGYEAYCRNCRKIKHQESYEDNLFNWIHRLKKSECKTKGLAYDLDPEFLESIWTGICPIYKVPLRIKDKSHSNQYALDRIVPSKGYIKGNVCFISSRANRIKYDANEDELQLISNWLRSVKESSTTIP